MEGRALGMVGNCSMPELHLHPPARLPLSTALHLSWCCASHGTSGAGKLEAGKQGPCVIRGEGCWKEIVSVYYLPVKCFVLSFQEAPRVQFMVPVGGKSLKGYCLIQLVPEDKENIPHDRSLCVF